MGYFTKLDAQFLRVKCEIIYCWPRKKSFPETHGGKAFDTGLIMAWLEAEVAAPKAMRPRDGSVCNIYTYQICVDNDFIFTHV